MRALEERGIVIPTHKVQWHNHRVCLLLRVEFRGLKIGDENVQNVGNWDIVKGTALLDSIFISRAS